ncbi:MAG: hypothetical protein JO236_06215 [Mycobacterium sp.]|uniref:hypothetical protein n=1 Tax=Mycobacterium sp. TaxID=1785 RepID=UPI001ED03756|nr:hypothetical protein [Mycobacterium sp.]MBW0017125.1 hypothetical protein [Mycobacterium sp.]
MDQTPLGRIDAAVEASGCYVSADRQTTLALVQEAVMSGKSATFYMPKAFADEVFAWYWTTERAADRGLEPLTSEELAKIKSELGITLSEQSRSNRIPCPSCDHLYGGFEFIQQGLREHGRETVETAIALPNASVVRVNPRAVAVCPNCETVLAASEGGHEYVMDGYGCCKGPGPVA